jgi:hypothetical protein
MSPSSSDNSGQGKCKVRISPSKHLLYVSRDYVSTLVSRADGGKECRLKWQLCRMS